MIELCDIEFAVENKASWETVRYLANEFERRGFVLSRIALREKWAKANGLPTQHRPVFQLGDPNPHFVVIPFHGGVEFKRVSKLTVRSVLRDTEEGI